MFEPELVRKINARRCFALIGAGPSCELGYPNWAKLAADVRDHVFTVATTADRTTYDEFMQRLDYPALFSQAELDLGSRQALVNCVKRFLVPASMQVRDSLYAVLSRWPFACYLTTNYDDELQAHLGRAGHHFTVLQNGPTDLAQLRDGTSNLIVKVHSDLQHPDQMILTSRDYDNVMSSPAWDYWRVKLRQVFEMFDVVILGHGMRDPDLELVLRFAKQSSSPMHPIYMIVGSATQGQIREFSQNFNIQVMSYDVFNGDHGRLRRLLQIADRFIDSRDEFYSPSASPGGEDQEAAVALFLFRRLHSIPPSETVSDCIAPLILSIAARSSSPLTTEEILSQSSLAQLSNDEAGRNAFSSAMSDLERGGLIEVSAGSVSCTVEGKRKTTEVMALRDLEEEQALGQFVLSLREACPQITAAQEATAGKALKGAIVNSFRARGLTLANVVFAGQSLGSDELPDIFRELTHAAQQLPDFEIRAAFIECARLFLVEPTNPQQKYLTSISQGYFLYHLTGLDPACSRTRRQLIASTSWFLDSSVLLPLFAKGCHNHDYVVDLFRRLKSFGARLFTTSRLLIESWEHLHWALEFVKRNPVDSPEFLALALTKGGFKQNLFIDGYISLAAEGAVGTFADYLDLILQRELSANAIESKCSENAIPVLRLCDLEGFQSTHWAEVEELAALIAGHRKTRGTFRGQPQVDAEAEVLVIIRRVRSGDCTLPGFSTGLGRVYFISPSRALDAVSQAGEVSTWTPEAIYRYATSISPEAPAPELLQECMLNEYYYAGVSLFDKPRYQRFFGPAINQAKLSYRREVDNYLLHVEQGYGRQDLDEAFDRVPDLEKPFFVSQMMWKQAEAAAQRAKEQVEAAQDTRIQANKDVREALKVAREAKAEILEERKKRITAEQKAARLRNLGNPKHVKRLARRKKKKGKKK